MNYEYLCTKCGHVFTVKYRFAENPRAVHCLECGEIAERYFGTAPPVMFKGQGWASKSELDAMDPANDNPQNFSDITGV